MSQKRVLLIPVFSLTIVGCGDNPDLHLGAAEPGPEAQQDGGQSAEASPRQDGGALADGGGGSDAVPASCQTAHELPVVTHFSRAKNGFEYLAADQIVYKLPYPQADYHAARDRRAQRLPFEQINHDPAGRDTSPHGAPVARERKGAPECRRSDADDG
jgi:hypothetical protein